MNLSFFSKYENALVNVPNNLFCIPQAKYRGRALWMQKHSWEGKLAINKVNGYLTPIT